MGNFFSQPLQRKADDGFTFNKRNKLEEGHSAATENAAGRAICQPFSQVTSGLAILTGDDRGDSTFVLATKVGNGMVINFETTPFRYATVRVCRQHPKEPPLFKKWFEIINRYSTKMGNFFSQPLQRKADDGFVFNECKKLEEEHSAATDNGAGKAICEPFSQETSGLAILTREDRGDSTSALATKVGDGRVTIFETTPVRYAKPPLFKKLRENIKKYSTRLNALRSEVKLTREKIYGFQIVSELVRTRDVKSKNDYKELFRPLKSEDDDEVSHALYGGYSHEILVTHQPSNIVISRGVLQCLRPGAWLNDEVINLYLELLKERERREHKKFLKCHFFNTFFYKKLTNGMNGYDFRAVRRWTTKKKLGHALIDCDKVFVPIHKNTHWSLAVINIKDETFHYLDSFGGMDTHVLNVLERYLMEETKDKCDAEIDCTSWKMEAVNYLPLQKNGWDCGMFMIKYADFHSRGLELCFTQDHMEYFRKRTAGEILRLRAE